MIPTIGIMIGGYIIFRALELILAKDRHIGASRTIVLISGLLLAIGTGVLMLDLLFSATQTH